MPDLFQRSGMCELPDTLSTQQYWGTCFSTLEWGNAGEGSVWGPCRECSHILPLGSQHMWPSLSSQRAPRWGCSVNLVLNRAPPYQIGLCPPILIHMLDSGSTLCCPVPSPLSCCSFQFFRNIK